jgi:hypothetical protein
VLGADAPADGAVLYDQTDNPSMFATLSDDASGAGDASEVADDFDVFTGR